MKMSIYSADKLPDFLRDIDIMAIDKEFYDKHNTRIIQELKKIIVDMNFHHKMHHICGKRFSMALVAQKLYCTPKSLYHFLKGRSISLNSFRYICKFISDYYEDNKQAFSCDACEKIRAHTTDQ